MKINSFYRTIFKNFIENLIILIAALLFAVSFLAVMCGYGNKGLLDLL